MKLLRNLFAVLFVVALVVLPLVALAQPSPADYTPPPTGSSLGDTLMTVALPFVVMGATWLVTYAFPKLPGWLVPAVIVPVLSTIIGVLSTFMAGTHPWWMNALVGLGAVLVHQVKQQVDRADTVSDTTKVKP